MTALHSYNMPIANVEMNSSRLWKTSYKRSRNPYHSIDCYNFITVVFYLRLAYLLPMLLLTRILFLIYFQHISINFENRKLRRHELARAECVCVITVCCHLEVQSSCLSTISPHALDMEYASLRQIVSPIALTPEHAISPDGFR